VAVASAAAGVAAVSVGEEWEGAVIAAAGCRPGEAIGGIPVGSQVVDTGRPPPPDPRRRHGHRTRVPLVPEEAPASGVVPPLAPVPAQGRVPEEPVDRAAPRRGAATAISSTRPVAETVFNRGPVRRFVQAAASPAPTCHPERGHRFREELARVVPRRCPDADRADGVMVLPEIFPDLETGPGREIACRVMGAAARRTPFPGSGGRA